MAVGERLAFTLFFLLSSRATNTAVFSTWPGWTKCTSHGNFSQTNVLVPQRNETAACATDPGCRVVRAIHQAVLQQERRPVGDQRVALHLAEPDTTGAFSTLQVQMDASSNGTS